MPDTLPVGNKAPDFTLKDTNGKDFTLSNQTAQKNVVLLFFPLAFSSVCSEEFCQVRDNLKIYEKLNASVVGVSVDSFFTLNEFRKAHNLNVTLVSDFNKEISQAFGALYDDFFGMRGVAKRAAFVIDQNRIIRYDEVLEDSGNVPDFAKIQSTLSQLG